MQRFKEQLEAHQVRIYFLAMAFGALSGALLPDAGGFEAAISPALALMLFATFLQVPIAEIAAATRNARFLGALVITNFVVIPVIAAALLQFTPHDPLLRLAILFVLLAPCIDYVIAFTHLGSGNARLLLAMTPLLLVLQMLLLPLYLQGILGNEIANLINARPFVDALVWLIALPLCAAGLLQALAKGSSGAGRLQAKLDVLPVPATALVLFIVPASVMPQIGLARDAALQAAPIYIAYALIAPVAAWLVARALRLETTAARAVSFSASYRNSLVILPLAFAIPGGTPLVPAVILTQTITELVFLPMYLKWIPRFRQFQSGT